MSALKSVTRKTTPQTQRTLGRTDEVKNSAGGYVFEVSDKTRLQRFLVIGVEGDTYYASERARVEDATNFLIDLIRKDEALVLSEAVRVSDEGLAYSNTPAVFAVAAVMSFGMNKAAAREAVTKVCRTATHLYEFAQFIDNLSGWGRSKRVAVADWFANKGNNLDYQAVKYRQRNGWTLKDVARLGHAPIENAATREFILNGNVTADASPVLKDFARIQAAKTPEEAMEIFQGGNLPWEAMPTSFHKSPDVWKSLFYSGNLKGQALVRNITRLARLGAFSDMQFAADYAAALTDGAMIERTRLHPINYLNAAVVYKEGQVQRKQSRYAWSAVRNKDWTSESVITDALNDGFHAAFKFVEPAGKRTMLALDVSGSMSALAMGLDLSCAQISGAMAMTIARTEPAHIIRGFTGGPAASWRRGNNSELTDLGISAKTSLGSAMRSVQDNNFSGTDCALPMLWAKKNKVEVDTFVVLTDSESWQGEIKAYQALDQYQQKMGIDAKVAVVAMEGNDFTIAEPGRAEMLDIVGFSSDAPKVLADFSAGRI